METFIFKYFKILSLIILIGTVLVATAIPTLGKVQEKERTRLRMYYSKLPSGYKQISVILTSGRGKNTLNVADATINLSVELEDSTLFLTDIITKTDGTAELQIEEGYKFPTDEDGFTTILAEYDGNDSLRAASSDLEIKDVFLTLSFEIEDSLKILTVKAEEPGGDGNRVPVEGLDIKIGIERLYSILDIDVVETDEEGLGILEFPNDLPGDSLGNLKILALIDDHDDYGTMSVSGDVDWGLSVSYYAKPLPRQLYSDEAPLWMITAVFIILMGAWYHFFLSIFKLYKLKKAAKIH